MKQTQWLAGLIVTAVVSPAFAQVPALDDQGLPSVNLVSPNTITLDRKEVYGINLANQWKTNPEKPHRGADGSVKYLFGVVSENGK